MSARSGCRAAKPVKLSLVSLANLSNKLVAYSTLTYRRAAKLPSCQAAKLTSYQAAKLPSCQAAKQLNQPYPADAEDYYINDKATEKQYKFVLKRSLEQAQKSPFLSGWSVFVTKTCKPSPDQFDSIISKEH